MAIEIRSDQNLTFEILKYDKKDLCSISKARVQLCSIAAIEEDDARKRCRIHFMFSVLFFCI